MNEYLLKWKHKYRCRAIYDLTTGEYIRNPDGSLDGTDIYIECQNGDQIYDYDSRKSIMEAYITSKQRGRRIISEIYKMPYSDFDNFIKNKTNNRNNSGECDIEIEDEIENQKETKIIDWDKLYVHINKLNNNMLFDIHEYNDEITFKFNGNKYMDTIAKIMKAKKPLASPSPI